MTEKPELTFVVTSDRMADMDLTTFYNASRDPRVAVEFVAHFVVDEDGSFLEMPEAVALVSRGRKLRDLEGLVEQVMAELEEVAVPNE